MKYLKVFFRPMRAATIALGAMVFVSGCETTVGLPEICKDPQVVPRDSRCPPLAVPVKKAKAPAGREY